MSEVLVPAPSVPPPPAAEAVLRFLESTGKRAEAEFYLRLFRNLPKESFAIVLPGAPVIRQGLSGFVEQLRFLTELGLSAPLVLGLLDPASADASAVRLLRRLEQVGVSAERVAVGSGAAAAITTQLRAGVLPVIALDQAEDAARQRWVSELAAQLGTRKLALIRRRGGFALQGERRMARAETWQLALEGNTLSLVNLKTDAELLHGELLGKLDRELLSLAQELVMRVDGLMVSVTSPLDLLRELFTVRGAGTLIKRGSEIARHDSYGSVERSRLSGLFEASFERKLGAGFFGAEPRAVYVEQEYRGAAVVCDTPIAPYLSKFAVEPAARGEGVGRDLWTHLTRDFPRLFWRTRADNPTRAWYVSVCDTMVRRERWHIFLRGTEPDQIPAAVRYAEALGDDFES
ncbi:MAG TPA: hypothetical protein PKA88_03560 [Polyangiaceae bacterium]|nr:hypothetical protein [Polyangiaceae bacterium]